MSGIEVGFGLRELLIDFRSIDVGEQCALRNSGADIEIPLLQVAVGTRVDGRLNVGLHGSRKHEIFLGFGLDRRMGNGNGGNGHGFGVARERLELRATLQHGDAADHDERDGENNQDEKKAALLGNWLSRSTGCSP